MQNVHQDFYTSIPLWLQMVPPKFTYYRGATGRVTDIRMCLDGVHCRVGGVTYTFEKDDVSKLFMQEAEERTRVCINVVRVNEVDKKGRHTVKDRLIAFKLYTKNVSATNVKYKTLYDQSQLAK